MMNKSALLIAATFLTTAFISASASAGDAKAGEELFNKKCKMCHTASDNGKHGMGPNLMGVMGRSVGMAEGYTKYSDAMKGAGVKWDAASLGKLITDPAAFAAGNKMTGGKISDAAERDNIIAYIETLK
jgi:cytochrome c